MTLTPIGDIGVADLTTTEMQTWETETDWSNAVDEKQADHYSTPAEIRMGYYDNFEDNALGPIWTGSSGASFVTSPADPTDGSVSLLLEGSSGDYVRIYAGTNLPNSTFYLDYWVRFPTSGRAEGPTFEDSDGSHTDTSTVVDCFWDQAEHVSFDGNARVTYLNGSQDTWYRERLEFRDNGDIVYDIDDVNGNDVTSGTVSVRDFANTDQFVLGQDDTSRDDQYVAQVYLIMNEANSYLTTAIKSFAGDTKPDLVDLDYDLNGESITVDVIGSPGTADEEIVSQTLDGAVEYSLSWTEPHTDFRVQPQFDMAEPWNIPAPVVRSLSLEGVV